MNLIKTHLIKVLICTVLSIIAISIIPLIQRIFINKDQEAEETSLLDSKTYSNLIFSQRRSNSTANTMIFIVTLISFCLTIVEYLFVKVSASFAFTYFSILFELFLFAQWPIVSSIHGFTKFPSYYKSFGLEFYLQKQNVLKYIRLFAFTLLCAFCAYITTISKRNEQYTLLFFTFIYFCFNNFMYWVSNLLFASPEERNARLKESFSFSKEGLTAIFITLVASIACIKYINSL